MTQGGYEPGDGRAALERFAPRAGTALDAVEDSMWRGMRELSRVDLADLAARVCAVQHGLPTLERPAGLPASPWTAAQAAAWRDLPGLAEADRVAIRFAEQLCFDVASLAKADRDSLFAQLRSHALPFAMAAWAMDFLPRARFALDALFGPSAARAGALDADVELAAAIDGLVRVVPQLESLDPVTTELVRLLGARHHRCRLCQSLRSRPALVAGADEALFEAIDHHATSDLSQPRRAALAFAEGMIATPARIDAGRVEAVRKHFPPAARVELVLDVTRNATNKLAVALGADAPHVESGTEVYEVGPDGALLYGLEAP